ncbi:hypothetical protein ACI6QG_08075 [Roseococcus sp. DSY-14]|uniref:hypothetical protein n=1 Tax=Roseococcus sp. DSY-14 TaxID=3369650 RepID=UPI00387A8597
MPGDAPSSPDPALAALDRLEAALDSLFDRIEARFARLEEDRVPRAEVEDLSRRLDEALGRLKLAMSEGEEPN